MKPIVRVLSPNGRKLYKPTLEPGTESYRILECLKSGPKTFTELQKNEQDFKGPDININPRFCFILGRMVIYNQLTRIKRGLYQLNQ